MLMRWEDEPYVKFYVRDTPEFLAMSLRARCLLLELVRKVDRAGTLKVGTLGIEGIAIAVRAPLSEVEAPIRELLKEKRLEWNEEQGYFIIPNHIEAQTTPQSEVSRKRREREFARAARTKREALGGTSAAASPPDERSRDVTGGHAVAGDGTGGHAESRDVTRGHEMSLLEDTRREERDESGLTRARGPACAPARARATHAPIDPERVLSSEGRAYAESVGVTDVERVHRDFVNYNVSEARVSANWEAMWRRWCDRELRIQRRERDRSRSPQAPMQQDAPGEPRGWEMPPIIHLDKEKPS
jgi:hypothetical protein